jgi:uncharacterized protein (TIGR03437 family)
VQAGRYQGIITLNGNTPSTYVSVPVYLNITAKTQLFSFFPATGTAGGSLNFTYTQFVPRGTYQPLNQFVTIWSSQQNYPIVIDETYASPSGGKWLLAAASKRGTLTPVFLQVIVDPTGLAPGTYQGNIRATAGSATNSPLLIPVTLTIRRFPNKAPEVASVTNGASLQDGAISEGARAAINLDNYSCSSDPVVTIDGVTAPVVGNKNGRLNIIVPSLGRSTRSQVQVTCDGQSSAPFGISVAAAAPGLVTDATGSAVADTIRVNGRRALRLFGTGFGPMVGDTGNQIPSLPMRASLGGVQGRIMSLTPSADLPGIFEMVMMVPETVDPTSTVSLGVSVDNTDAQTGMRVVVNN